MTGPIMIGKDKDAAKGALVAYTGPDAVGVVPAGREGEALVADPAADAGVRWGKAPGGGGMYLDKEGNETPYVFVVSDTDPGKTTTVNGETVEVWWVQTTPPDPMQSTPIGVTQSVANRSYTVPDDPAATYTIDGVAKSPGTYSIGTTAAKTIQWAAVVKSGYGFKAGAVTSGSLSWDAKTYVSGDVLMSDSFNRADSLLLGSTSDSFQGGEPYVWTGTGSPVIRSGAMRPYDTPDGSTAYNGKAEYVLPATQATFSLEFTIPALPTDWGIVEISRADGTTLLIRVQNNGTASVTSAASGTNQTVLSAISLSPGQGVRLETNDSGVTWSMKNTVTGAASNWTATGTIPASKITKVDFKMQAYGPTNFQVDSVKVMLP